MQIFSSGAIFENKPFSRIFSSLPVLPVWKEKKKRGGGGKKGQPQADTSLATNELLD